jgi:3-hydroxy-9,10-secoandrosta-1,3,5(10)-triene-9,17-dione monooxygenase reductase component
MELRHDMLTHGIYIVCAQHEGRKGGLTVAWATQVARNRILICVGSGSATRKLILASRAFGLSVLRRDQLDVARAFGTRSSAQVDKFEGVDYHTLETNSPLLDNCAATFDCRVETVFDGEGGQLIIGEIVAAERLAERYKPLIFRAEDL